MKKAEIIKNGNVNLKPIKTGIDWGKVKVDFKQSKMPKSIITSVDSGRPFSENIVEWFKKRIEKELNSSE